jgi:hypothetical protein
MYRIVASITSISQHRHTVLTDPDFYRPAVTATAALQPWIRLIEPLDSAVSDVRLLQIDLATFRRKNRSPLRRIVEASAG